LNENPQLDSQRLLERLQERITWSDQTEKNLSLALVEISRLAVELSLPPPVLQRAALLYKQVVEKRLTRGRSVQALCAAVIYVGCRECGSVRDLREVAKVARMEKQEVIRYYRIISRELDFSVPATMLTHYAPRILVNTGVQGKSAEFANKILNVIQESRIAYGREPASLVSAAAYLGSKLAGEKVTQRQIAIGAGLTEVTVRNSCKQLQRELDFVMSV
jgi:transcription initiation factor TFIIB